MGSNERAGSGINSDFFLLAFLSFMVILGACIFYMLEVLAFIKTFEHVSLDVEFLLVELSIFGWFIAQLVLKDKSRFLLTPSEIPVVSPGIVCAFFVFVMQDSIKDQSGLLTGSQFLIWLSYGLMIALIAFDLMLEVYLRASRKKSE